MTIVTQDNTCLNYRFIRMIDMFEAELDNEKCFTISAIDANGDEIDMAVYSSEKEAASVYEELQKSLRYNEGYFKFPEESEITHENRHEEKYKNRFVSRDEERT